MVDSAVKRAFANVSVFKIEGDLHWLRSGDDEELKEFPDDSHHIRAIICKKEPLILTGKNCACCIANEGPINVVLSFSDGWSTQLKAGRFYQFYTAIEQHVKIHA